MGLTRNALEGVRSVGSACKVWVMPGVCVSELDVNAKWPIM